MGFYYSLYEWYNPLWLADKPRYIREHMTPQFKDLVTRYRPAIVFSDGEWDLPSADWRSPELLAWLFNESPVKDEVVVNDRWGKDSRHRHGGYWTTEYTPGMSGLEHYRTGRELVIMLVDAEGQWRGDLRRQYNKEFETAYDVTKLAAKPAPGKAGIEAFFTSKGGGLFAILPRWPGRSFLLKDVTGVKSATLLGYAAPLKFQAAKGGVSIQVPEIPEQLLNQPAWALKVSQ
jgi:alpha-L-fucosidase